MPSPGSSRHTVVVDDPRHAVLDERHVAIAAVAVIDPAVEVVVVATCIGDLTVVVRRGRLVHIVNVEEGDHLFAREHFLVAMRPAQAREVVVERGQDLPGLGVLFRNRARSSTKREMLVFITPKVIADKVVGR